MDVDNYKQDPKTFCEDTIRSLVVAADWRPPASGTIIATRELGTWSVDPHSEDEKPARWLLSPMVALA
jgi:hypothetical protein